MRKMLAAAAVFTLALVVQVGAQEKDASKLIGTWTVTSQEQDGKKATATDVKGKQVRITRDTITCTTADGKTDMAAKYELDTSRTPHRVTLTCTEGEFKDKKIQGIAQLDGDTLKMCWAKPDGTPPTEFKGGEGHCCVVLERSR